MPLPYTPLWQALYCEPCQPVLLVHKNPQIWASYLGLYNLAVQGGRHIFLAKGYEKEAFYRATYKWLSHIGLESFLTKNGLDIAGWGSLSLMYPLTSLDLIKSAKSCLIASPYVIKKQYYQSLVDCLPSHSCLWIFHPERLPLKKGDSALSNQVYQRYFWHRELKTIQLPKQVYNTYEEWKLVQVWLRLLSTLAKL